VLPRRLSLAAIVPCFVLVVPRGGAGQTVDSAAVDAIVERARSAWDIPGVGLAIVQGDSVLLAKGYGVREIGRPDSVDGHTLFAVGSASKAFTATAVGILVDEGALAWDDRVVDRVPGFVLHDPWVTGAITIRDLLAHRSGLPMANLQWLSGLHSRQELVHRLRFLELEGGFRAALSYQNVLYAAVGLAIEKASGSSWDAFLSERILRPVGMQRTRTTADDITHLANVAAPHARVDGEIQTVPWRDIDPVGPAGSIVSSARDMARWLAFQSGDGAADGVRILSASTLAETRVPQIAVRREGVLAHFYPDARLLAYGLGWMISDYRGRAVVDHPGGIDGMTSVVALLPQERVGVTILTNLQTSVPPYAILYPLLDLLLDRQPVDRSADFLAVEEELSTLVAGAAERVAGTTPSLPLEEYAGRYTSAPLGAADVAVEGSRLVFRHGRFSAPLERWHFDTFRAPWTDRAWRAAAGSGWIRFHLGADGGVEGLFLEAIPGERWEFAREPPPGDRGRRSERPVPRGDRSS